MGYNQVEIAKVIGRHKATVSLKLAPNRGLKVYRPKQANSFVNDGRRAQKIAKDIIKAYREGRKILGLTVRTEHLDLLQAALAEEVQACYVLHGRLSNEQRATVFDSLSELDGSAPRFLLRTGHFIGEGFDYPPLDTLFIAMPISWKGTLQQYAGRLHREHSDKKDVRVYDYGERDQPELARVRDKRERGYRAMSYKVRDFR